MDAVAEQLAVAVQQQQEEQAMAQLSDQQLFVIDRTGSKTARKKLAKEQQQQKKQLVVSKVEQVLLAKTPAPAKKQTQQNGGLADLWATDEPEEQAVTMTAVTNAKKKTSKKDSTKPVLAVPCHPGQSYHPSLDDHQEVLAEALAVETAILEKKMEEEQLIPTELSEVTKSVLMDGEDWVEEQEEDEGEEGAGSTTRRQKRKERLTTAQINKRRRKNQAKFERQVELRKQSVNKGIDKIEKITKALEATEERRERRRQLEQLIKTAEPEETVVPITPATVATVPLSDELKGSLRSMKPKGNLLEEHVGRMATTSQVNEKKKQKKLSRPHGTKRVKLYEKYK